MCLCSKTNIPEIAKEDIICYKIIEKFSSDDYVSPYIKDKIIFNKTIIASKLTKKINTYPRIDFDLKSIIGHYIGEGLIHAFIIKEDAKIHILNHYHFFVNEEVNIVKCIIPKGSRYFISIDNVEICSDRMMITDEIIYRY